MIGNFFYLKKAKNKKKSFKNTFFYGVSYNRTTGLSHLRPEVTFTYSKSLNSNSKSRQHFIAHHFFRAHKSVPFQVIHCSKVLQPNTHHFFNNPKSTQVWSSGTMTRHYSRYSENKFFVLPLTLKPKSKRNPVPISAASHFPCHSLSKTNLAQRWKQYHLMPHDVPVRPPTRFPRAPRQPGFTLF
jgi:hypothetical protein